MDYSKEKGLSGGNKVNLISPSKQSQVIQKKKPCFERSFIYGE